MKFTDSRNGIVILISAMFLIASCKATRPVLQSKLLNETPTSTVFSPDGKHLAAGVWGGARIWDLTSDVHTDYPAKLRNETPKKRLFLPRWFTHCGRSMGCGTYLDYKHYGIQGLSGKSKIRYPGQGLFFSGRKMDSCWHFRSCQGLEPGRQGF